MRILYSVRQQSAARRAVGEQLALVRDTLKPLSQNQWLEVKAREAALGKLVAMPPEARRDATACVLIERGLSPVIRDIGDEIRVRP